MYKLIVSDFDGTLIDDEERVPISTVMLFDELRRNNKKIAIATGRSLKSVLDYDKSYIFMDYIISSNGAYIYDVCNDKIIYKKNILISNIKKIVKKYYDQAIIYLTDNNTWNLISKESAYQEDYDIIKQNNIKEFINNNKSNIYKMELYFKTKSKALKCLKEIKEDNTLKVTSNIQIHGDKYIIEVTHQDIDKLVGVEKIVKHDKINLEEVIAFGDGHNDISLLKKVGLSVAVDNAVDEVKKVVKDITLDNNHKGVEIYLKKLRQN